MSATATKTKIDYSLKSLQIVGYTKDVNTCECCGKEDLKGTVVIRDTMYDTLMHFGTTCAASADKYDTLDAAKRSKVKIQTLTKVIRDMEQNAACWAIGQVRIILNGGERKGSSEVLYSEAGQELLQVKVAEYIAANNDKVIFNFLNKEAIEADRKLASAELRASQEYMDHEAAIELANKLREKGDITPLERIHFFGSPERKAISNALEAKRTAIHTSYPSLKYVSYLY